MITLPNIIIQYIVEELLNEIYTLKRKYKVLCNIVLVSKQWNLEIIPKIRFGELNLSLIDDISEKWIEITQRYNIKYKIHLRGQIKNRNVLKKIRDSVISVGHVSDFTLDTIQLQPDGKYYFENLTLMEVDITGASRLSDFEKEFKVRENVVYVGRFYCEGVAAHQLPQSVALDLFNSNIFRKIFTSFNIPKFEISCGNHWLTQLTLYTIHIDPVTLCAIIEKSPNLTHIDFDLVKFSDGSTSYEPVIQSFVASNHQNLIKLYLRGKQSIHFSSLIHLYNNIKCQDIYTEFKHVFYDSVDQVLQSKITNTSIQIVAMTKTVFDPPVEQLKNFNLFSLWSDRSNIKKITTNLSFPMISYYKEMVSLEDYGIEQHTDYPIEMSQEEYDAIISYNLVNLSRITVAITSNSSIILTPTVLLNNFHLKSVNLSNLTIQQCISLLDCQHPTIKEMRFPLVSFQNGDLIQLTNSIKNNTTLHRLSIYYKGHMVNGYNVFTFLFEILRGNRTLRSIYLPQVGKLSPKHVVLFDMVFARNFVIRAAYIPNVTESDMTKYPIYMDLINLYHQYSIDYE
ncbi:hypothetical protein DLAC_04376 [Tieghemostelium lacteum]|uniref:Uncharacterized protein n=1 Tax=Tieghemostelium lacteum TaxID=361077 RepID=A0A151ZJJ6_TIELA|nr:hypothetical protein DLAC_04376 [Tieghemostelium lacteum]|eukprot:KYQ94097.1 hypothetical protein DLAC_04376 [Tieghemostelium lacteum]